MGLVVLTDRPGWRMLSESKVIEPMEVLTVQRASDLLQSVEAYAMRVLRSALKAYDDRVLEGFKSGEANAQAQAVERLYELEAARSSLVELLRPSLTELLIDAVSRMAHEMPRERLFAASIASLEEAWRHAEWGCMRVHPLEVEAAQTALHDLAAGGHRIAPITVLADDALAPGCCRFESDLGFAEAGLDVHLAALREAFSDSMRDWGSAVPGEDILESLEGV